MLKVPNRLLEMGLSPNALKLYVFLLSCADAEKKAIVRVCRAAERCGCSAGTVRAGIKQLEQIGLVRKQNRYNQEGQYIANLYLLTPIAGGWSALDTENDIFTLSGSTFAVYLYLVCRKNGHSSSDRLFCPCWFSPTASFQLRNKPVDSSFCVVTGWVQALLHKN